MFFQPGKRKGNPGIQIYDPANKRTSVVCLPATISDPDNEYDDVCSTSGGQISSPGSPTDSFANDEVGEISESESEWEPATSNNNYQVRKARLSANWEKIREDLTQTALLLDGFLPKQCTVAECINPVHTRCRDCEFGAYYCLDCCNRIHRDHHQFHLPEVYSVSTC